MTFSLRDINAWYSGLKCVPTALCAVSGKTPGEIGVVLAEAAARRGHIIPPTVRDDYNINDWLEAVRVLGGQWDVIDDFSFLNYAARPSIEEFMAANALSDLLLVFGDNDTGTISHVFAAQGQFVVDSYTRGKRIPFGKPPLPDDYKPFRVKRVFSLA